MKRLDGMGWSTPAARVSIFSDLVEDEPQSVEWRTAAETRRLLSMMSPVNRAKVERARPLQIKTMMLDDSQARRQFRGDGSPSDRCLPALADDLLGPYPSRPR